MDELQEQDLEAQIRALVDVFIEGITPREALVTLDEGPAALEQACHAWAFEAAEEIEGLPALDTTSAVSLLGYAPILRRLKALAIESFTERFGKPQPPRLPRRPEDLGAVIEAELRSEDKRPMSRSARILCHSAVYGACMSSEDYFYVTRSRDRRQFVLWIRWENHGNDGRWCTNPVGWLPAVKGLSEHDAALFLLEDFWKTMVVAWDEQPANERTALGRTITQDELDAVTRRVWPDA